MKKSGTVATESNSVDNLSEYADAEERISAPTELLAEFLYSVMIKDYEKALDYCTQILSIEPDYATMQEFRPLIEEKLKMLRSEELEDSSSESSFGGWSTSSGSSDNLNNESWEEESSNSSSGDESDDIIGMCKESTSPVDLTTKSNNSKEVNTCRTRTIINRKLPPLQTQTRVLRRENTKQSTLLHPTNTRVLSPRKDNNSRTLAWFNALQKNIFGSKRQEEVEKAEKTQ